MVENEFDEKDVNGVDPSDEIALKPKLLEDPFIQKLTVYIESLTISVLQLDSCIDPGLDPIVLMKIIDDCKPF